jgi:hypothetical protein
MPDHLYQIYYSEPTRQAGDPGFLPLDNLDNPRPDWREYWPIRQFLMNSTLDERARYGFFSPKFQAKTGLDATAAHAFLAASDAEVVLFSPFFDQSALFLNVYRQAEAHHPGIAAICDSVFRAHDPAFDTRNEITHSTNTVFCNFFAASPRFWRAWLAVSESIFAQAEDPDAPLAAALNGGVPHDRNIAPCKVFVIERVASFLLSRQSWRVAMDARAAMPDGPRPALQRLDALKIAYARERQPAVLANYRRLRSEWLAARQIARGAG